jgi:hypothetical protein
VQIDASDRWLNGVNVWGYPCDVPANWDPCSVGTFRNKGSESTQPVPRFDSFVAYLPISCTMGHLGPPEEFAQRAVKAMDATVSMAIEDSLSQGSGVVTNPYFGDTNLDILGGGAVAPNVGLAYLEDAIGATGRRGMIHMTPSVAAYLGYSYLTTDGVTAHVLGTGTPVAVGDGYIGADPASGSSPSAGQSWMFATGPVEVYMTATELIADNVKESLDRSDNTLTYRAEVSVLAMWDTCLQAGVLVDWSP